MGTLCAIASSSFFGKLDSFTVVQIILVRDAKWQRNLHLYGIAANHALSWFAAVKILTQKLPIQIYVMFCTVFVPSKTANSEIFAKLGGCDFRGIKPLHNSEIILSFTDVGNHALVAIFNVANMSFNVICENKILAKFSEFSVQPH